MKNRLLFFTLISFSVLNAQIITIPDANFKQKLLDANSSNNIAKDINENAITIDINNDGEIQISEVLNVYRLNVENSMISDLTGVNYFINLTHLKCSENQLHNIDITQQSNLESLDCYANQISNLDVSQKTNLKSLICGSNPLYNLDITQNINLEWLNCYSNYLSNLDVSQNINLTFLWCNYNQLNSLDVSHNTGLTSLYCQDNPQLNALNVSQNINLDTLVCYNNPLSNLDVSQNTNLTVLWCINNQLSSLDVSQNINLISLGCGNNQLNDLDITQNTNLTNLWCNSNLLSSLDVSQNIHLEWLLCHNNPNLSYINLKNGNNNALLIEGDSPSQFSNLPNLQNVCVDALNTDLTNFITTETGHSVNYSTDCNALYVEDNQMKILRLFPNPVKDYFIIESENNITTVEIYNELGQLLNKEQNTKIINTINLTKGVYIVNIKNEKGSVYYKTIIKN